MNDVLYLVARHVPAELGIVLRMTSTLFSHVSMKSIDRYIVQHGCVGQRQLELATPIAADRRHGKRSSIGADRGAHMVRRAPLPFQ